MADEKQSTGILFPDTLDRLKKGLRYPNEFDDEMLGSAAWLLASTSLSVQAELIEQEPSTGFIRIVANIIAGSIMANLINDRVIDPRETLRFFEKAHREMHVQEAQAST